MDLKIIRATLAQIDNAYAIVQEYYESARVELREDHDSFRLQYFTRGAGVWLAEKGGEVIGCVALRACVEIEGSGEIKRMYVRPKYRGRGVSDLLLDSLEEYARQFGYMWLYLDTAAEMKAAARFYERKGFTACERYNTNPQAAVFMRKSIGPVRG
jgi:GNAT superfamily N-acetyltransferase